MDSEFLLITDNKNVKKDGKNIEKYNSISTTVPKLKNSAVSPIKSKNESSLLKSMKHFELNSEDKKGDLAKTNKTLARPKSAHLKKTTLAEKEKHINNFVNIAGNFIKNEDKNSNVSLSNHSEKTPKTIPRSFSKKSPQTILSQNSKPKIKPTSSDLVKATTADSNKPIKKKSPVKPPKQDSTSSFITNQESKAKYISNLTLPLQLVSDNLINSKDILGNQNSLRTEKKNISEGCVYDDNKSTQENSIQFTKNKNDFSNTKHDQNNDLNFLNTDFKNFSLSPSPPSKSSIQANTRNSIVIPSFSPLNQQKSGTRIQPSNKVPFTTSKLEIKSNTDDNTHALSLNGTRVIENISSINNFSKTIPLRGQSFTTTILPSTKFNSYEAELVDNRMNGKMASRDAEIAKRNQTDWLSRNPELKERIWIKMNLTNEPNRILNVKSNYENETLRNFILKQINNLRIKSSCLHDQGKRLFAEYCTELRDHKIKYDVWEFNRNVDRARQGLPSYFTSKT